MSLFDRLYAKKERRILLLGLDAAGKTTILYKLKIGEVVASFPTIGFNIETLEYKNVKFQVWDVGGQERMRHFWRRYYIGSHALIYVVDSSDRDRIDEARETLHGMLQADELKDASLLVFANKQDLGVMSIVEVSEKLKLHSLRGREWYVQGCCALTGDGLYDGLDWLAKTLEKKP